jgi:hypothetical protein
MAESETIDPTNPEPSPEATVRLPAGPPADPYRTQQLDISKHLAADSTMRLPQAVVAAAVAADQTQKLPRPRMDEPPIRIQRVDQPAEAEGQTQKWTLPPAAPKSFEWRVPLALAALLVVGVAAYLVIAKTPSALPRPMAVSAIADPLPHDVQVYMDQAKSGDTHAMRMLGAMYLQGLSVPKDREKGLYWYRKAAENGSDAARSELQQIEGSR